MEALKAQGHHGQLLLTRPRGRRHGDWIGRWRKREIATGAMRPLRPPQRREQNHTLSLADESAAFDRLAQGGAAYQATTRSACSTLPLVSGASTSERAKLSAPTQVPIIIGIA